ncbi:Cystinosin like protein [Trachymyrmex septentrionalis]|uniref:Cystinosin homolog n=2 Tax=Trachymyrmex septentrionalis TaxID=34720 RepID=A0A195FWH0_9HYME|nr:Cystinosin like protein [Trachymyrmex septentrionalis]
MALLQYSWILLLPVLTCVQGDLRASTQDLEVQLNQQSSFNLSLTEPLEPDSRTAKVTIDVQHPDLLSTSPSNFSITPGDSKTEWIIYVKGLSAGHLIVSANVTPSDITDFSQAFVRVTIEKSDTLYHISAVVGWIYFLAWSVSFYPQIYINYKRKSVVGLNFDYVSLNLVGFLMYALFNCGLYWIPEIEKEYFERYPKGLNPVQINDIFFSLHAVFASIIVIGQCFIHETGNQRVSTTARIIHGIFAIFILISLILSSVKTIQWLDFLYYCSYVKLSVTLIKYVPQAFYNYRRKSTVGWSIGNVFLDFTGGILSMLQMILNAYNYDDWESIFGDPTKFGLGFFSVAFDVFFLIQHYVLYRMITSLARIGNSATVFRRSFNCWTAAITKKHRPVYERTYPTTLVFSDGSSIEIEYHEPRKIIVLPLNLAELTEAERKRRLEMRKPKTKIVIAEEFEDNFDENRYLNFKK